MHINKSKNSKVKFLTEQTLFTINNTLPNLFFYLGGRGNNEHISVGRV